MSIIPLLYGATIMLLLLDIKIKELSNHKKVFFLCGFLLILISNIAIPFFSVSGTLGKFYTLTAQIPMLFVLYIVSDFGIIKVFFVTLTAIFLTFPLMMTYVGISQSLKIQKPIVILLCCMLTYLISTFLVSKLLKPSFNYMLKNYKNINVLKFCFIPILYNVLSYILGKYNYASPIGITTIPARTLMFVATLSVYFLFLDIFKATSEMQRLQDEYTRLEAMLDVADKQLCNLQCTDNQTRVYRHDMRHHFSLIVEHLINGETEQAIDYIKKAQLGIDEVIPVKYCLNNTVNLILSANVAKAEKLGVTLKLKANLPQDLFFPETELCAILSNGLENAITASAKITDREKFVYVYCNIYKENLLIQIENPYLDKVAIKDGIPQSNFEGHGFGVKSIDMLTKKHNGYCSFLPNNGIFILKVVLPLS